MFRSKREIDAHVTEVYRHAKTDIERALKSESIAKLYYQVGEYNLALTYLDKYDQVRKLSATSLKLRGQIYEGLASSVEAGEKSRYLFLALQAYRRSYEYDLSQKALLPVIAELLLQAPPEDSSKSKYWLEEAERNFPHNKSVKKLREKLTKERVDPEGQPQAEDELNGNGDHDSDDNLAYWSTSTGGGSSFLNSSGIARLEMRDSTSTPRGSSTPSGQKARFEPRPSPERLAGQIKSVEAAQEKMLALIQDNGKSQLETLEGILAEVRGLREERSKMKEENEKMTREVVSSQMTILKEVQILKDDTSRYLRENTRALKDASSEMTSMCEDVVRQLKNLVVAIKTSRDETDEEKPKARNQENLEMDLLAQQYASRLPPAHLIALMQMSQLGGQLPPAGLPPPALPAAPLLPLQPMAPIPGSVSRPTGSFDLPSHVPTPAAPNAWPSVFPIPQQPQPLKSPLNIVVNASTPPAKEIPVPKTTSPIKPSVLVSEASVTTASSNLKPPAPAPSSTLTISSITSEAKNSPFSTFTSSPFSINVTGGTTPMNKPAPAQTGSLFANLTATPNSGISFGTPGTTPGLTPKKETSSPLSGFSFSSGAATTPAAKPAPPPAAEDHHDDGAHDESADQDHDPHFEPIIPLPELVQVKTGEEDEEELFGHKAKIYRFDPDAKEWKERGLGIIKILKHPVKGTFRVLLRREQIHKIAANHFITKDMEIKPFQQTNNTITYSAMDFADEELKAQTFAVKFKLEETKDEFKRVFEKCQSEIKEKGSPVKSEPSTEKEKNNSTVAKDLNLLDKFKMQPGAWECSGCMCRNEANVIQCPACQQAKPGHEDEVKAAASSTTSKLSFGGGASTGSGFNITVTASTSTPTSGFKFGSTPTTSSTTTGGGFTFGSSPAPASAQPKTGFLFGKTEAPASDPTTTPSSGFSFGKSTEKSSFAFTKPPSKPETSEDSDSKPSPFATFSFGLKSSEEMTGTKGVDLSESKNLPTFASLASGSGSGFGFGSTQKTTSFAFSGAGAPVFGSGAKKEGDNVAEDRDDEHVDTGDHDPHFEPIIPLPELVEVKTGEEDEEELFAFKGKMFRYDGNTKEWKERGVGKVKILKHRKLGTFRVLLRREQIHKIAVNHAITKDIALKPMPSSTNALCYYAMDFSEEELKNEYLAVKFKLEETVQEFKKIFEECQKQIPEKGASPIKQEPKKETVDPCVGLKNKVEELTSLDQFKPKADSWECSGCLCRNDGDKTVCPSCQTPKSGLAPEPPKSEFSFSSFVPKAQTTSSIFGTKIEEVKIQELKPVETKDKTELSFNNLGLKLDNASDAKPLAEVIAKAQNVKTITFSGNTVGIDAAEVIGKALEKHPEFERAHWKDMFTGRMKTEIPPALKHLGNGIMTAQARLVELDLSDNAFGPIGMEGIVDLLKSPSCFTLKELKLNNTGCGVTGGKLLAQTLLECYRNSGNKLALKVFVLGRSRQENEGAKALAEVFKLMGSLEEIVMPQNGIYHEGIAALSDAFANNPNLRILNMNDNTFTEKGAQALAKALPNMSKLQVLNLGDCLLKTRGAELIANAIKAGHPSLEELYLDSNEICYEGGKAVIEAIANKNVLKILNLDGNQFTSKGCGKLMKQLRDVGKRHVLEEIEDDEEPEDDAEENGDGSDVNDSGDDDDDDSSVMFFGACQFYERAVNDDEVSKVENPLGLVDLRILYDDDVYGARIVATSHQQEDDEEETVCNHLIAIQTVLSHNEDFTKMEWSALDFSRDPPTYRHFSAEFEDTDTGREFRDVFTEGKDLAEQSEILENPELNPDELYYGQGGDYEEE